MTRSQAAASVARLLELADDPATDDRTFRGIARGLLPMLEYQIRRKRKRARQAVDVPSPREPA